MTASEKLLLDLILPANMLDYFEVADVKESSPTAKALSQGAIYSSVLDIYLDELDNRDESNQYLKANGFTEPVTINDFPIRDRKVRLHVRRRRWLDKDNKSVIINKYPIYKDGTRYSIEFADFLKEAHGYDTSHGEVLGEDVLR